MPKRYLYLIRNAAYVLDSPPKLTDLGRAQALRTMQALRHLPIKAMWCSPAAYSVETASILAEGFAKLEPTPTIVLRQYQSADLIANDFSDLELDEAGQQSADQMAAAQAQFFAPVTADEQLMLVCHGTLIRDMICMAMGVNPQSWAHMLIHHCGISCLSLDDDGIAELMVYDDINHLPDALHSA